MSNPDKNSGERLALYWLVRIHEELMTTVDVVFKYGLPPTEDEVRAISDAREVYGIRKISFNEKERTVRVEFDATRLKDTDVANLLRNAGLDIESKVALV
jgi:hypothetical protein